MQRSCTDRPLPLIKRRKRLFSSLDSWTSDLRSYHTEKTFVDGLQTIFINIDRTDRVSSGNEWRDIRSSLLIDNSQSSLIQELEKNADKILEADGKTPYKYLRLVCLLVSYFRKLVWDLAARPRKQEILGLETWLHRRLQHSRCSPQLQRSIEELLGCISDFMGENTKPTGALVRVLDRWLMERLSDVYNDSDKHMLLALAGPQGQGEFVASIALRWRLFHTLWWCVHQAPEILDFHYYAAGIKFKELIARLAGREFLIALLKTSDTGPPRSLWESSDMPVNVINGNGRQAGDWFFEFLQVSCRMSTPVLIKGGVLSIVADLQQKIDEIIHLCADVRTEVAAIPYPGRHCNYKGVREQKRSSTK
jgi:hypothetical protein